VKLVANEAVAANVAKDALVAVEAFPNNEPVYPPNEFTDPVIIKEPDTIVLPVTDKAVELLKNEVFDTCKAAPAFELLLIEALPFIPTEPLSVAKPNNLNEPVIAIDPDAIVLPVIDKAVELLKNEVFAICKAASAFVLLLIEALPFIPAEPLSVAKPNNLNDPVTFRDPDAIVLPVIDSAVELLKNEVFAICKAALAFELLLIEALPFIPTEPLTTAKPNRFKEPVMFIDPDAIVLPVIDRAVELLKNEVFATRKAALAFALLLSEALPFMFIEALTTDEPNKLNEPVTVKDPEIIAEPV
jgi:hypothetical protein